MMRRTLEIAILIEARAVLNRPTLRAKDLQEWNTCFQADKEIMVHLPRLGVYASFLK